MDTEKFHGRVENTIYMEEVDTVHNNAKTEESSHNTDVVMAKTGVKGSNGVFGIGQEVKDKF